MQTLEQRIEILEEAIMVLRDTITVQTMSLANIVSSLKIKEEILTLINEDRMSQPSYRNWEE